MRDRRSCLRAPDPPAGVSRSSWEPRLWTASWPWLWPSRRGGRAKRSLKRLREQPLDQLAVADALELRLLGHQAQRSHARLGVDLEQVNARFAQLVVPAEVRARCALAAEELVRPCGHVQDRAGDLVRDFGRANVLRQAIGIFGGIVV